MSEDIWGAYKLCEEVLKRHECARNNSKMLERKARRIEAARMFGKNPRDLSDTEYKKLTPVSSIVRARRKIQNEEGRLVPTRPEVILNRAKNEEEIREWARQTGVNAKKLLKDKGFEKAGKKKGENR